MRTSWLHISDFHLRAGEQYDRDVVLRALVASAREQYEKGRSPDLIFATGDIANSGRKGEYEAATPFFDALLDALGLTRERLFVIPGNHDVNREQGIGLARTLESREEADAYFGANVPKPHISQKLGAYHQWYDEYFSGIREFSLTSACGPLELVDVGGCRIAVLPLNSALFCQDDADHDKLLIGRRSLEEPLKAIQACNADLRVALIHHPLEWLSAVERSNIRASLHTGVDVVLRGHLHETDVEGVVSPYGGVLHVAAGAAYQSRRWPNRAMYAAFDGRELSIFPIRYEDTPTEIWTVDPSVFPRDPGFERSFPVPRVAVAVSRGPNASRDAGSVPRFRSNVPTRGDLPFVGRDELLQRMVSVLGDPGKERIALLHGPPGVGKTELAREFARLNRDRYPGGAFVINCSGGAELVDVARIGANLLGLQFPAGLSLSDQCERTLSSFAAAPVLLVLDNPPSLEAIKALLPPSGMPCHVLITSTNERLAINGPTLEVLPLDRQASLELIAQLAGSEAAGRHGQDLVAMADGLPVQIVPACRVLAYEARRGRLESATVNIVREAQDSFHLVYAALDTSVRLLLHVTAFLAVQHISRTELFMHVSEAWAWEQAEFGRRLDACLDFHLLEGNQELRMHQLFASFLLGVEPPSGLSDDLARVRQVQGRRFVSVATRLCEEPASRELASAFLTYRPGLDAWIGARVELTTEEGEAVGGALLEIGRFDEARPWLERAVNAAEQGNAEGLVDHASLGGSLHRLGYCLTSLGKFDEARPWFERAAEATKRGNVDGLVDHASLGTSLHQVGVCLSRVLSFDDARRWFERAVEAKQHGDVHGRISQESLGVSLHEVGYCLSSVSRFDEAQSWFERAVEAKQHGDVRGRINQESLGASLHQVGYCLSAVSRFDEAQPWFERAVEAAQQGDVHGRIDHTSLGISLYQVGFCLSGMSRFDEAQPWFERAVEAAQQGDVHGRIDHESLGKSLHQVGVCLSSALRFDDARRWFERAVEAQQHGDIHGRIDHSSTGTSQHQVGICFARLAKFAEALPWFERAVESHLRGDIHGRVDHARLGRSLHETGRCFSSLSKFDQACPWFQRAVEASQQGDIQGQIDSKSLAESLSALASCLRCVGRHQEAGRWEDTASRLPS